MENINFNKLFFSESESRIQKIKEDQIQFAHYTSTPVAISILQNKEIWLRNTNLMNDHSEVTHGITLLKQFQSKHHEWKRLRNLLDSCGDGVYAEIFNYFEKLLPKIVSQTYICCLSEHKDDEDVYGRLSMWRAYGGNSGAAIIFNNSILDLAPQEIGVYMTPVSYKTDNNYNDSFSDRIDAWHENIETLKAIAPPKLRNFFLHMLRTDILATKHPGFSEEREWRIIGSPETQTSPMLSEDIVTIHEIPQKIMKLRIDINDNKNKGKIDLYQHIEKILIGPCKFPEIQAEAIYKTIEKHADGNHFPEVRFSGIPLRLN